jgi:hypothetical protein
LKSITDKNLGHSRKNEGKIRGIGNTISGKEEDHL